MDTQEAKIFIAIVISASLIGVIILFFAVTMFRQQKKNLALQKANLLAELRAMEKERARIAADLHDDLGPVLSTIKFQVDYTRRKTAGEEELLSKASEQLDILIDRLREIAYNLMPSTLERKGLRPALDEFIGRIESQGKFRVHFDCCDCSQLPEDKQLHLFRTIQELVHNCVKHAEATELTIRISQEKTRFHLLYGDNGKGFPVEEMLQHSKGIGLKSLRNRTQLLDGEYQLESKPGKGTACSVLIPIN